MSDNNVVEHETGPGGRWWLPVLLVVLILAIIAGAYYATHRNMFGKSATATPRLVTATSLPATGTPKPGPTGTPRPGPTATPKPGPSATPKPTPRPSPTPSPTPTATATASG